MATPGPLLEGGGAAGGSFLEAQVRALQEDKTRLQLEKDALKGQRDAYKARVTALEKEVAI